MSSTARKPSARPSPSGSSTPKGRAWISAFGNPDLSLVFVRAFPFALFIAFIAIQPLFDERWVVVLRGLVVGAVLAILWPRYVELREGPALGLRGWAISIATGAAVFVAWIFMNHGWMVMGEARPFVPLRSDGSLDPTLVALRLAGMVAVVPLMEELFWRSFLMRWIDRRDFLAADPRRTTFLAIAVSSALFATAHTQWLAGLLAGAVYAAVFVGIGNLRAAIASHATTNALLGGWILATRDWSFW